MIDIFYCSVLGFILLAITAFYFSPFELNIEEEKD